jgi:uncharacterized protein YbjT (DUF2867 family)
MRYSVPIPELRSIKVDVRDERSVADALADAYGAVNAVSLYLERGQETFHSIHVESAERIATQAERAWVKRLIHVSGIGADARSQSLYIRKRGEGELAVRKAFADAILIRPAVMFGPNDAFLTAILKLLNRLPVFPMFGNGQMRLPATPLSGRRSMSANSATGVSGWGRLPPPWSVEETPPINLLWITIQLWTGGAR